MSDANKPLLDKPANAENTAEKPPNHSLNCARRIHNLVSAMFLAIMAMVYGAFQLPSLIDTFQNIWIVFAVTIVFIIFGVYMTLSVIFNKSNNVVAMIFLVFLTFSMGYFIVYLAASADSPNAGYIAAFMMAFINIAYSVVYQISSAMLTPTCGIVTGILSSIIFIGILFLADVYILETPLEEVSYLALAILLFVTMLYSVYIFCNIKGIAEGTKEAVSSEDYVIAGITVYLDFSLGLIIAIARQICSQIAG